MKDKYYDFSSSIVIGIILLIVGNTILIGKTNIYKDIISSKFTNILGVYYEEKIFCWIINY